MDLLVITGPPGSGKTTVAERLAALGTSSALVSGDAFFTMLRSGAIPPWSPRAHDQNRVVTAAAAVATGALVRGSLEVIYDGVLGPWFLPEFLTHAGVARADYVILLPDLATCLRRVRERTGHGFTDEDATGRMHSEFATATADPRHVVDPSSMTVAGVVAEVRRRRAAGLLRIEAAAAGPG